MADKPMADKPIEIYVNQETGNFTYTPAVYNTRANVPISWRANGNCTVQFRGETPLDKVEVFGQAEKVFTANVRKDAPKGIYHYAVAVAIGVRVFFDAGCPTIIVN